MSQWDKLNASLLHQAVMQNDRKTKELVTEIMRVPHFIKEAVLREYASRCRALHAIAHFQWRNRYKGHNDEIEENFRSRVAKVFTGTHDLSKALPSTKA